MIRSFIKLRRLAVAPLAAAALASPAAAQQQPPSWTDAAVIGAALFASVVPDLMGERLPYARCAPCDSTRVWSFDRVAIGPTRETPKSISDATLVASVLGSGALVLTSRRGEPSNDAKADLVTLGGAVVFDHLVTQWVKVLVHRPRPIRYTAEAAQHMDPDEGRSFPSGHSSVAFAATAATWTMLAERGEADDHAVALGVLAATSVSTAVLRVGARRHFPTDVIAGAVLGSLVGWGTARLR